ncbi:cobalamin biosynthesis protein CobW, partial [Mesorhizobium sp. M7A.F.Ca.US.001.01.1.1]
HILIETSGLALPKPLVQAFQWPSVKSRATVDGVIAVVDGPALAEGRVANDMEALQAQRAGDETLDHDDPVEEVFEDQIACADLIILSKSDLMDAAGTARANAIIGEHSARAVKILPTSHGKVDPAV